MKPLVLLFAAVLAAPSIFAQPALRLSGSTTVAGALEPRSAVLEHQSGRKIIFQSLGSTSGLMALAAGQADVAMISSPIEELAQRINDKKPGTVRASELQAASIGAVRLVFVVNPRNPVRQLSAAQLVGVLTGKIKNWSELGGNDVPVTVVSLANAGPLLEERLLAGAKLSAVARHVPVASQIVPHVAQEPGAIGIVSAAHPRGRTSLINTDAVVQAPLFLVTRGEPAPDVVKLIAAARKLLEETGS